MKRMLFNATFPEELRVAIVNDNKLVDFDIEINNKTQKRGNVYKGTITRVEQSLEACFVDYGSSRQGFLPFKEIGEFNALDGSQTRDLTKLKEGVTLIVQIEKDERGNKGAALTTNLSLPGRYLVLMPNNSKSAGISRRIDGDERDELKTNLESLVIQNGMGIIARTAALGKSIEELQWDLDYLTKLWDAINQAGQSQSGSFLIYQESNLVVRSIRDYFSPEVDEVLIDTESVYDQAKQFVRHVIPSFADRVKLYSDKTPLFTKFDIETQINAAYDRVVHLPSGGSIVIDTMEALTAVDVNSARANKGSDIEVTALNTNLEACVEIAKQLRLRDLGGLVVIDFIDMENQKNQREVESFIKEQMRCDRARIQLGKLSKFGLLELSRQRLKSSLEESVSDKCPHCHGTGIMRSTESVAIHMLRILLDQTSNISGSTHALHIQLPVNIATYLLNERRMDLNKIEERSGVRLVVIPNEHIAFGDHKIRTVTSAEGPHKLSFDLVEKVERNSGYKSREYSSSTDNTAVVKNIMPRDPAPRAKNASVGKSLVKWIKGILGQKDSGSSSKQERRTHKKRDVGATQPVRKGSGSARNSHKDTRSDNKSPTPRPRRNNNAGPKPATPNVTTSNNNPVAKPAVAPSAPTSNQHVDTVVALKSVTEPKKSVSVPNIESPASLAPQVALDTNVNQTIAKKHSNIVNTIDTPVDLGEFSMVTTSATSSGSVDK